MQVPIPSGAVVSVGLCGTVGGSREKKRRFSVDSRGSGHRRCVASATSVRCQSDEAIRSEMRQTPRTAGYLDDIGLKYKAAVPHHSYFAIIRRWCVAVNDLLLSHFFAAT